MNEARRVWGAAVVALCVGGCADPAAPRPVEATSARPTSAAPSSSATVPATLTATAATSADAAPPPPPRRTPESFAAEMTGTVACGKRVLCKAGKEVCVAAPDPGHKSHCEPIASWLGHRTPKPSGGFPAMAGITACDGSSNCPEGSVCCLHQIGDAEVQAVVCHAALDECREPVELCADGPTSTCRTPGTVCVEGQCQVKP